ncbi:hypothetical protein [Thalassoglobus polymorphus]|uniref:Uncharacterized protein n=1 Tax=Thalassoglobus polymorphus TaxID=2527994 RepID=A0A517QMK3_9PLAN|nr:hypothetical protein [Thalassoglobus polymorphus]QDT32831.1 hypothetical protein Mal48_20780 [Thalassoglobus polymorphus]
MAILKNAVVLLLLFKLTGCTLLEHGQQAGEAKPYSATLECAEVAWDVGAMRYKKYSDECPALIGWFSLCGLPLVALADTAVLPVRAFQAKQAEKQDCL